jgi:hypothetical protein
MRIRQSLLTLMSLVTAVATQAGMDMPGQVVVTNAECVWWPERFKGMDMPAHVVVTNPAPNAVFAPGTTSVPVGWIAADWAETYEMKLLQNATLLINQQGITETDGSLDKAYTPGYYTLFVRATNAAGPGPWSSNITFIVERNMFPDGTVSNRQPKVFRWSRSELATRYQLKLFEFNKATGKYALKRDITIPQPDTGSPKWTASRIPDGRYRWSVTDFKNTRAGYTQSATFRVLNSGVTSWNDPALIKGTWRVDTDWRWRQMTFQADGVVRSVQADGAVSTRARWSADEKFLTLVSDVVEKCPYTVTATTLTFTTPKGTKQLVRVP